LQQEYRNSVEVAEKLVIETKFSLSHLQSELSLDPEDWFKYLRTDEATYLELLQKVIQRIQKSDAVMIRAALRFGS
jgi:hypothetical protein